jgi:SAM-dependent methyltransferase
MHRSAEKPLIFIGIPTWGKHSYLFTQSIIGAISPSNFSMQLRFIEKWEVGRARNLFAQEAVNQGAKYLMFRDEDTLAPANLVTSLLQHLERNPSWTFVGGLYATKSYPPEPLVYTDWLQGPYFNFKKGELLKVLYTGMGASLIRVSDLLELGAKTYKERSPWTGEMLDVHEWFKTSQSEDISPTGIHKEANTEDAHFFMKLHDKGLKAYVDTNIVCGHYDDKNNTIFFPAFDGEVCTPPDAWNRETRIINLGAGGEYNPFEVQVDLADEPHIDYRCDIRSLPDEWEGQFDVAKAHHVLEHFDFAETATVLAEWLRILKPGGKIEISVPDLQVFGELLAEGKMDVLAQGGIWGDQAHPYWQQKPYGGYDESKTRWLQHSNDHNHHKSGFTARFLIDLMKDIGFVNVTAERRLMYAEIHAVGYKDKPEQTEEKPKGE